jgi:hypothetical protein
MLSKPMETVLSMPGDQSTVLQLGAYLTIRNESEHSAEVRIVADRVERCDDPDQIESTLDPPNSEYRALLEEGRIPLKGGDQVGIIVRHGPTLAEWVENGGDKPILVSISAQASPDGAVQSWRVTLECPLLGREHGNASSYRVQPFQLPTATCTELTREYPQGRLPRAKR